MFNREMSDEDDDWSPGNGHTDDSPQSADERDDQIDDEPLVFQQRKRKRELQPVPTTSKRARDAFRSSLDENWRSREQMKELDGLRLPRPLWSKSSGSSLLRFLVNNLRSITRPVIFERFKRQT